MNPMHLSARFAAIATTVIGVALPFLSTPNIAQAQDLIPDEERIAKVLENTLRAHLANRGATLGSDTFTTEFIDLNADGVRDALVLMTSPNWCGTGGCTMLIFKGQGDESAFRFVSDVSLIREPLYLSSTRTNGWRDLIVNVSGGGIEPKVVALRFNGQRYPKNPSIQDPIQSGIQLQAREVFPVETDISAIPATLTVEQRLSNGLYQVPETVGGEFQLQNGEAEVPYGFGETEREIVRLVPPTAQGDLNGDGVDDAATILSLNSGGSGNFIYLAALVNADGQFVNVGTQLLGDRLVVQGLSIDNSIITVSFNETEEAEASSIQFQLSPAGVLTRL